MTDFDVVIVGAGPSGATLAKKIGDAGKTVLVLEAGGNAGATWDGYLQNVEQYQAAAIKVPNSPYLSDPDAPSPSVLDIRKLQAEGPPSDTGYFVQKGPLPFSSDYLRSRAGTTMHWLGTCLRMLDADFDMPATYGVGEPWPTDRETLTPLYELAEREMGVAANVEDQTYCNQDFGDYVYPMERIPPSWVDGYFSSSLDGRPVILDDDQSYPLLVSSTPQARNSMPNPDYVDPVTGGPYEPVGAAGAPHEGLRCEGNSSCIPICPVQAKWNAGKTLATLASTVTTKTQCVVSRVLLTPDRRTVAGIEYIPYGDGPGAAPQTVTASIYVLAGSAVENAKLLLASEAGNSSDQVGRNLMDHPYVLTWALAPENVGAFRGPSSTSGFESLRDGPFRSERAAFRIEVANWGWDFAAFSPYSDVQGAVADGMYGHGLRSYLEDRLPRQIHLGILVEQLPDPNNRVTIDDGYTDALGQPRPVISYNVDDYTRAGMAAARSLSNQVYAYLQAEDYTTYLPTDAGYVTWNGQAFTYHGAGHTVGTHRMGADASTSVVDTSQRSWDHANLYVVGCGSMPTIGTSNPTLTMMALVLGTSTSILADLGVRT
jgi:choline dehydrogenase-like flavoprotein